MWRIGGRKDCVFTRGDLAKVCRQSIKRGGKVYRKELAEATVPIGHWKRRSTVMNAGEGVNFRR